MDIKVKKEEYQRIYNLETKHWWYLGMKNIAFAILSKQVKKQNLRILDAGCGTGGMMLYLQNLGKVSGIDTSFEAIRLCHLRNLKDIKLASIEKIPFQKESFDLVTSFDVLYHQDVKNDQAAISEFQRVLKPGGYLLIRVPAYNWLRGKHDLVVATRHRYTLNELSEKLKNAGFEIKTASYANTILFPTALLKRTFEKFLNISESSDVKPLPKILNDFLKTILSFEGFIISKNISLPFGLSVHVLAQKPN